MVSLPDGTVQYQLRNESDVSLEMLNLTEKQRFMDGEKTIAIISEAASSGISLQSDKRVKVGREEEEQGRARGRQKMGRVGRDGMVGCKGHKICYISPSPTPISFK